MSKPSKLTRVAIAIPVFNRRDTTLRCLRSLERINAEGCQVRVFILDDGSTDGTAEAIQARHPDVKVIRGSGSLHYAAGTNRAIEACLDWQPDFVLTANDDAVFHQDFIQRLLSTAVRNPRSIVGALLLRWDQPHVVFQVAPSWSTLKGGWQIPADLTAFNVGKESFKVETIVGNCVLLPIEAINECGLMDEKQFPLGWGDAQWLVRFRKAGWKLLVEPRSFVWCEPNTYPQPLHERCSRDIVKILFTDKRHPQNLHRQWVARRESAPSSGHAALAFTIYVGSLLSKSAMFGFRRLASRQRYSDEPEQNGAS